MPETLFDVRWPDGTRETCYSPSSIIKAYLAPGAVYTIAEFVAACGHGLRAASERVREVYGYSCTQAMAQLSAIEKKAESFDTSEPVQIGTMGSESRKERISHG